MSAMPEARLIIFMAIGDERGPTSPWQPVLPEQVPSWIKDDPGVVANLVGGDMAHNRDDGSICWYRAEKADAALNQLLDNGALAASPSLLH